MAKISASGEASADALRRRLEAGGFVLEEGDGYGGYQVRNVAGDMVFGRVPFPFSATEAQIEAFLIAQGI